MEMVKHATINTFKPLITVSERFVAMSICVGQPVISVSRKTLCRRVATGVSFVAAPSLEKSFSKLQVSNSLSEVTCLPIYQNET